MINFIGLEALRHEAKSLFAVELANGINMRR